MKQLALLPAFALLCGCGSLSFSIIIRDENKSTPAPQVSVQVGDSPVPSEGIETLTLDLETGELTILRDLKRAPDANPESLRTQPQGP